MFEDGIKIYIYICHKKYAPNKISSAFTFSNRVFSIGTKQYFLSCNGVVLSSLHVFSIDAVFQIRGEYRGLGDR